VRDEITERKQESYGGEEERQKREKREKVKNEKGERGRRGKSPITKSLLTTFLHTAVGVSRVIQCSKAKSELIGWRRNF